MRGTSNFRLPGAGRPKKNREPSAPGDVRKRRTASYFAILLLAGALIGCLLDSNSEGLAGQVLRLASGFADSRVGQTAIQTFLASFYGVLVYLTLLFIFGFCAVSAPLISMLVLFRGLGIGVAARALCTTYGVKGYIFTAVVLLPPAIVFSWALIGASCESLTLSSAFLNVASNGAVDGNFVAKCRYFCVRMLFYMALSLLGALLDVLVTLSFAQRLLC